jgi:DNA-directed RNA polymerase specialized sigma24 family protein
MDPAHSAPPLSDEDWGRVFVEAKLLARKVLPGHDADDVVTEGITRVLEGDAPWDPESGRTLAQHVVGVGYNARRNAERKARRRSSDAFVVRFAETYEESGAHTTEDAMAEAEEREHKKQLFERLVADCAGDAEALALLECEKMGIHQASEQAAHAGLDIGAVRNARKRIARRARALLPALAAQAQPGDDGGAQP